MSNMATEQLQPAPAPALTGNDRCDRCGAQAYVETGLNGLDMLWCGHHFGRNADGLLAAGAIVLRDERSKLNDNTTPGAEH